MRPGPEEAVAPAPAPIVVRHKVTPPELAEGYAPRLRVDELLASQLEQQRVVLVAATAGAGKSSAVAAAVARSHRPVAWLTVGRSERAPGRLVAYLDAAVARAVPAAEGVARRALTAGVPHAEAAALLAETVAGAKLVLVVDELERLGEAEAPWAVLESLLRSLPRDVCAVLVSRHAIPTWLCSLPPSSHLGHVGDAELAFTCDEARAALRLIGKGHVDPQPLVDSTDGWVTGVLFQTGAGAGLPGLGRERDPLYDYLSSQILDRLGEADRHFLICCSVLEEVSPAGAATLGFTDGAARLESLRALHLPATWAPRRLRLRCHSAFREFLLERLSRMDPLLVRELKVRHAALLVSAGHHEEAVEELLEAGVREEAVEPALHSMVGVAERLDLVVADRWLAELDELLCEQAAPVATTRLMLAIARGDVRSAVAVADGLGSAAARAELARDSERSAWLMVWAYLHAARLDDARALLEQIADPACAAVADYTFSCISDTGGGHAPPSAPPRTGGPLDAMLAVGDYGRGRLLALGVGPASRWEEAVDGAWRTGALRALGRTREALARVETALAVSPTLPLLAWVGPEVMIDAGRRDEALALLVRGRRAADTSGSVILQSGNRIVEAKLRLRLDDDPAAARAALDSPECGGASDRVAFIREVAATWRGAALLRQGDALAAREQLEPAVASMQRGDRVLELATAAAFLAEARWQTGDEEGADAAGDLALAAAERQGSNHLLLQALADVPAVCARRLELEEVDGGVWTALAGALRVQAGGVRATAATTVVLHEFGRRALTVDGHQVKPRIAKSYELLSYLTQAGGRAVSRDVLLDALFEGRRDPSARSYLRQALQWLRQLLPDGTVSVQAGHVVLAAESGVVGESVEFEQRLAEAARLRDAARLEATVEALELHERGDYLPGPRGAWADERGRYLDGLATDARFHAAALALGAGSYDDARRWIDLVVHDDPFRESAWRIAMRVAHATGDESGVLRAYRGCEEALAALRLPPAPATKRLLARLRG